MEDEKTPCTVWYLGEFGEVYKAHLIKWHGRRMRRVVAVKTLKGTTFCRSTSYQDHMFIIIITRMYNKLPGSFTVLNNYLTSFQDNNIILIIIIL